MKNLFWPFFGAMLCNLAVAQSKFIPYQELPTASGNPSGSGMFFGAAMSANQLTITFAGPSNKWIALGFGTAMTSTDAFIYSIGHSLSTHPLGWMDYYITAYSNNGVLADSQQDWTVVSTGINASSERTVVATRTLSTGDANDAAFSFTAPSLSLVWARGATNDFTIAYHGTTNRAYNITRFWQSQPTASFSAASATVCAGTPLTYSNLSTGGQLSYTWSFPGAGTPVSTATNPVVTYTQAGTYSVALTASNSVGTSVYTVNNYITVVPAVAPSVSISAASNTLCQGAPASFSANIVNGGGSPQFQWKVNNVNTGPNNAVFTSTALTNNAILVVVMQSNAQCASPITVTSAPIQVSVFSSAAATATIGLAAGSNPMCLGAAATFTAATGNAGSTPSYQWKINGQNTGTGSPTLSTSSLQNGDLVSFELTSSAPCASSSLGTSNVLTMTVSSVLVPQITIGFAGSATACAGAPLTFTASLVNGGSSPSLQWKVNNVPAAATFTFTTSSLQNGDLVNAELQSSSACANPQTTLSAPLTATIVPVPPAPLIAVAPGTLLCAGGTATLSSSASGTHSWSTGSTSPSITTSVAGVYAVTQEVSGCTSLPSSVSVSAAPLTTAGISSPGVLCISDAPLTLSATPAGGQFSGSGVLASGIFDPAAGAGTYEVTYSLLDANNCPASASISITVSECLALAGHGLQPGAVFPNPAQSLVMVETYRSPVTLSIYNTDGIAIYEDLLSLPGIHPVSVSHLPEGLYILRLYDGKSYSFQKLMISR